MKLSPIGAFGGMAYTMGKFGIGSLLILGKFMLTFYITVLIFIFLILNGIMRYYGFSLIKLLIVGVSNTKCISGEMFTVSVTISFLCLISKI